MSQAPERADAHAAGIHPLAAETVAGLLAGALRSKDTALHEGQFMTVPIAELGYVRTDLLVGLTGQLQVEAVHRRYRGKRTESLFGGADAALAALSGRGQAILQPEKLELRRLTLKNEELYLLESSIVSFTQGLVWENGRLPSEEDRDLDIVHLRGSGQVFLGTCSPIVTIEVTAEEPVTVRAARLIGWSGALVPSRAPLSGLPEATRRIPIVRFEGSGLVLVL